MRSAENDSFAAKHARGGARRERCAEWAPRAYWQAAAPLAAAMAAKLAPPIEALEVYANEGRWVVECPDCNGAQLASRTDRRFMCNECANVAIGGLWRPVIWPADVEEIEAELSTRRPKNQHWRPGETAAHLRAENAAHGGGR